MEAMWIWAGLGLILLAAEMASGTLFIFCFGIAALCLAFATWLFPDIAFAIQLVMYAILSLGALYVWRKREKKTATHSRAGQSQGEEIGRTGVLVSACTATQNGVIRFTQGLMGSREWTAVANENIDVGVEAKVVAVEGNTLRVEKV
jgi:membrane protein implicated in regulation of membrane protease activity